MQHRDDQRTNAKGPPFSQRDSRARHPSPDEFNYENSKANDKNAEPSEVLWIGFPALLKVDEVILRKAFSPFGEIDKITMPGNSYAFVRFKSLVSACRAKETLQGKLFGHRRVHICFAKSQEASSHSSRGLVNRSISLHSRFGGRQGLGNSSSRRSSSFTEDAGMRSYFSSSFDSGEPDLYSHDRKGSLWSKDNTYEPWKSRELVRDQHLQHEINDRHGSPMRYSDFPPKYSQRAAMYEEPWDITGDPYASHGAKRLRTSSFSPDKELPEYLSSDFEREKHMMRKMHSDFPQSEAFDKNYEPGEYRYRQSDNQMSAISHGERSNNFRTGPGSQPSNLGDRKKFTQEFFKPSLKDWKWEGTIAKGGTPICCARCFPVGKVLDFML